MLKSFSRLSVFLDVAPAGGVALGRTVQHQIVRRQAGHGRVRVEVEPLVDPGHGDVVQKVGAVEILVRINFRNLAHFAVGRWRVPPEDAGDNLEHVLFLLELDEAMSSRNDEVLINDRSSTNELSISINGNDGWPILWINIFPSNNSDLERK